MADDELNIAQRHRFGRQAGDPPLSFDGDPVPAPTSRTWVVLTAIYAGAVGLLALVLAR